MKSKSDGSGRWVLSVVLVSIAVSMLFSVISEVALAGAGYTVAFIILTLFIVIGIIFDIVGVAVTSAVETPFHSMASHGETGAAESLNLIRSAGKVASICNDVIGDICGVMSGATSAIIVANIASDFGVKSFFMQVLISGVVAGLIIGGKATGKAIAIKNNVKIVLAAGKTIHSVNRIFKRKRGKG